MLAGMLPVMAAVHMPPVICCQLWTHPRLLAPPDTLHPYNLLGAPFAGLHAVSSDRWQQTTTSLTGRWLSKSTLKSVLATADALLHEQFQGIRVHG